MSAKTASKEWLEREDTIRVECAAASLGLEGPPLKIELSLGESLESSPVRHISLATAISWDRDGDPPFPPEDFSVEQLGEILGSEHARPPSQVARLVRQPIAESAHGSHRVQVFREDRYGTLEEVVALADGRLGLHHLRGIFISLLDTIESLHHKKHLFLRVSPWTMRVHPSLIPGEVPFEETPWAEELAAADDASTLQERLVSETPEPQEPQESPDQDIALADTMEISALDVERARAARDEAPSAPASFEMESTSSAEDIFDNLEPPTAQDEPFDEDQTLEGLPLMSASELGAEDTDEEELTREKHVSMLPLGENVPGFELRRYIPALEDIGSPVPALLDPGFRLFDQDEALDEVPVVMGFSPPEMFGRARAEIGVACDIFSLGMLLYYMVSGVLPPTSIYTRHRPSIPARHFRPDFPLGLQSIIARATRPDPRERYGDVASMRVAFDQACRTIEERFANLESGRATRVNLSVDRHIGIAKRKRNPTNQDQVFGAISDDRQFGLVVVADGVSTASYGSGDLASKCLSDAAAVHWEDLLPRYLIDEPVDAFSAIQALLNDSNDAIVDHVNAYCLPFKGNPHEVMGTTALVAILHNGVVTLGSLGDSRVYLQRGNALEQITIDHNLWTLSVLDGVPADNAMALPHGDALAKCLGTFYVEDQRLTSVPPQPDMFRFPVMPGDTLLMTTDGLIDFAGANMLAAEDNILSILLSEPNPDLACLEMILLANRGGGGDNIGLGILRFG